MPRKQKKHHFIYKTTNLINNKFYVGMHSTDNLEDGYFGSGKILKYSVRKHGISNHRFEILEFAESRESLKKREAEIVNEELLSDPLSMNLKYGGEGGWDQVNENTSSEERKRRQSKGAVNLNLRAESDSELKQRMSNARQKNMKKLHAEGAVKFNNFAGKEHSLESKSKIGQSMKSAVLGERNSQFGTCWICFEDKVKKIKSVELEVWTNLGWQRGRKFCLQTEA